MEDLLRQYAKHLPEQRLFSSRRVEALRARLREANQEEVPEGEPDDEESVIPLEAARRWGSPARRVQHGLAVVAAAVVAAIILAISLPSRDTGSFVKLNIDGAFDKLDLFRTDRSSSVPPEHPARFYVGVRVNAAAWLRIVAVYADRTLEAVPLNRSGDSQIHLSADREYAFGGYRVGADDEGEVERVVAYLVVIATRRPVAPHALGRALEAVAENVREIDAEALPERLSYQLSRRLHGSAGVLSVPQR